MYWVLIFCFNQKIHLEQPYRPKHATSAGATRTNAWASYDTAYVCSALKICPSSSRATSSFSTSSCSNTTRSHISAWKSGSLAEPPPLIKWSTSFTTAVCCLLFPTQSIRVVLGLLRTRTTSKRLNSCQNKYMNWIFCCVNTNVKYILIKKRRLYFICLFYSNFYWEYLLWIILIQFKYKKLCWFYNLLWVYLAVYNIYTCIL